MKVSELARRSGVPVPTIKYYLRIGLLPPGLTTARNQARYGAAHLRRLHLVRVLLDIGGLSVKAAQAVLDAVDRSTAPGPDLLAAIDAAQTRRRGTVDDAIRQELAALLVRQGWSVRAGEPALDRLAEVVAAAKLLDLPEVSAVTEAYAEAAGRLAECQAWVIRELTGTPDSPHQLPPPERVVAAVVLSDAMAVALHRLAREARLARLLAPRRPDDRPASGVTGDPGDRPPPHRR